MFLITCPLAHLHILSKDFFEKNRCLRRALHHMNTTRQPSGNLPMGVISVAA